MCRWLGVATPLFPKVIATGLAAGLPFVALRLGVRDPSAIAAPAMTTAVDVGGLLAYFFVAKAVFAAMGLRI